MSEEREAVPRRDFLRSGLQGTCLLGLGGAAGFLAARGRADDLVWQIDPEKCIQCGNCATYCVLTPSAVKCTHEYRMCGRCRPCFGYFELERNALTTAAENQLCPVGAITREYLREPYYEYAIDEALCIGCGKCVKGCRTFGNGSMFLQVRYDLCLNCNDCSIAVACPSDAFRRVPASQPYLYPKGHPDAPKEPGADY